MINKLSQQELKQIAKIADYNFKNIDLATQAFIHASYFSNYPAQKTLDSYYERLEFLGDRILGVIIAHMLYELFPNANEGELSKRFNALVNTDICSLIAQQSGLIKFMRASADLKKTNNKAYRNIYADIMEAFIAALYLDGGFENAFKFVYKYWREAALQDFPVQADAKTSLQEWAHKKFGLQPNYRVVKQEGPAHDPKYYIEVKIDEFHSAIGVGSSKRNAQIKAAKQILYREGVWKHE